MNKENKAYIFADVDVSNHVDNKGWAKYLNWAFVNDFLRKHDDSTKFVVKQYPVFDLKTRKIIPKLYQHYFLDPNTNNASVTVTVTFRNKSQTETLPCYQQVKHHGMVPVTNPDSMLVNKTAKRAEVKAAAELTGLGISLYENGTTHGADKVSNNRGNYNAQNNRYHTNYRSSNNYSNNYQNQSSNRRKSYSKTQSNNRKEPQEWVLKSIQKQLNTKYDSNPKSGKLFKSLYDNRNDLQPAINQVADMKHCSPAAAAYDIGKKYLAKLPDKPKHQSSDSAVDKTKKDAVGNF